MKLLKGVCATMIVW